MVLLGLLGALSLLPCSPTFASYWRDLVATHSSYDLSSWGSYVIVLLAFFPTGLAFLAIDRLGWLSRYKIQADAHVTPSQLGKLALNLLINFGITPSGLSEQLLAIVVVQERPDLAEQKNQAC